MAKKYALTGFPLGHSMSPPLHERLFALSGIDAHYRLMELPPQEFDGQISSLFSLQGFNVTIPHKRAIIPHLDALSEGAKRYGAVNTVRCGEKTVGYNTDVEGFVRSFSQMGISTERKTALVLGAGGAGRMMAIELALQGCDVTLAVRPSGLTKARQVLEDASALSPKGSIRVALTHELAKTGYALLCNATPVGMHPNTDAMPVEEKLIASCGCVFDAIYNPTRTRLLETAERYGIPAIGGMAMLVWQAVAAHEIWDGSRYQKEDIDALIAEMTALVDSRF